MISGNSTYKDTIDWLYSRLPMFQRIGKAAYKANLDNTLALDEYLGCPHRKFKSVHVAGTNGKGSVSCMLASVLQAAGYKTGLYTSPHLHDFRERIRIDEKMIPEEEVVDFVQKHRSFFEGLKPSFFELTVAMAFDYFARSGADVAVVEVGMGGRLDSTNIISPEVSVITNIGFDHTEFLGDTLEKIAGEKAGIIKEGIPVVIGERQQEIMHVFEDRAVLLNTSLTVAPDRYNVEYVLRDLDDSQSFCISSGNVMVFQGLDLDQAGMYQEKNIIAALATIDLLLKRGFCISSEAVRTGMRSTRKAGLYGRWQILGFNPMIVCDSGHNEDGIREALRQIEQTPYKVLHFVFGVVSDKNIDKILQMLPKDAVYYFTKAQIPRALDENLLAEKAAAYGLKGSAYKTVKQALNTARDKAGEFDMIFIGGSTFVVAEVV